MQLKINVIEIQLIENYENISLRMVTNDGRDRKNETKKAKRYNKIYENDNSSNL